MTNINCCMAFDNTYALGAVVTMTSIVQNINPRYKIRFFLLTEELSAEQEKKIEEVKNIVPCDILYINVGEYKYLFKDINLSNSKNSYISISAYYRLLMFKALPVDVDKCFYLDADIIVNGDISVLYESMSEEKLIMATVEFARHKLQRLGDNEISYMQDIFPKFWESPDQYPYFNSGFFLINLNKARELDIHEQVFNTLKKYPNLPYIDQDILNIVFGQNHREDVCYVHPKYNVFCSHYPNIMAFDKCFYKEEDIKHAIHYPVVFHFAGRDKPWKINKEAIGIHDDLWWYYCHKSPFHDLKKPSPPEPLMIPVIENVQQENTGKIYLLNKLMVLRAKTKGNKTKYYLFGLLPILKRKVNENKTRYYLFGFLPLIKIKSGAGQDA